MPRNGPGTTCRGPRTRSRWSIGSAGYDVRTCGIRTEQVGFADGHARLTRRLRQLIGVDCQSMPTSHAAVRHGVSWSKARRAEKAFLLAWDSTWPKRRPRHLGADEIHRGKAQQIYTVLSDLVHGEVIGLAKDRTAESLSGLLTTCLDARQRAAVEAVCTDMHRPDGNAVGASLPKAEVIHDKFHVLQHAGAALDEVRRHEFFRAGAVMRAFGRGKRWLLLRRWKTVRGSKRTELTQLFATNRRLFKAYVLRHPVRFGVVESLNTTIKPCFGEPEACAMRPRERSRRPKSIRSPPPIRTTAGAPSGSGGSGRWSLLCGLQPGCR